LIAIRHCADAVRGGSRFIREEDMPVLDGAHRDPSTALHAEEGA
jgi:hypothetical protein